MSGQDQSGGYPPPRDHQDAYGPPRDIQDPNLGYGPPRESQYPPPPGEEDDRRIAYHGRAPPSGYNLPSINQGPSPYDSQYPPPPSTNGYTSSHPYPQENRYPPPPPHPHGRSEPAMYDHPGPYGGRPEPTMHDFPPRQNQQQNQQQQQQQQMNFAQSAPRQRTAIACRYCRRRKIRCSGFDQNPEGRCSNCQRFQQECIFTPVSSQAQAFVPAHAVYPGMRPGYGGATPQNTQFYGAHGQPLPRQPQQQQSPYEYPAPSPTGSYSSYSEPDRGSLPPGLDNSRKRPQQDPHPSILPPPIPGQPPYARTDSAGRRHPADANDDLRLPPVTPTAQQSANYSPGSSTSSHSGLQPPQQGLPSMSRTPPPRSSPGEGRADPMSLGNIMEQHPDPTIDRNMLNRLGRGGPLPSRQ